MPKRTKRSTVIAKKHIIIISVVAAFLVLTGAVLAVVLRTSDDKPSVYETVATVDGVPITVGELQLAFDAVRSEVILYFYDTYGVKQDADFWQNSYGGESTRERMVSTAIEYAAEYKRQQLMMLEYGVITRDDMLYKNFYSEFLSENRKRASAKESGKIIYGPVQYTQQGYYDYLHNNRLMELYWKVNEKVLGSTEMAYDKKNFEDEFSRCYANIEVVPQKGVISQLEVQ